MRVGSVPVNEGAVVECDEERICIPANLSARRKQQNQNKERTVWQGPSLDR